MSANGKGIRVAFWPDGAWCSLEDWREFEFMCQSKSDDYYITVVVDWDEDGSPAPRYFR